MSLVSFSKLAFLTISCAILLGCSQEKVVGHLDKYLERLSRVIDVERHDDNNFQQQYLTESESYSFIMKMITRKDVPQYTLMHLPQRPERHAVLFVPAR